MTSRISSTLVAAAVLLMAGGMAARADNGEPTVSSVGLGTVEKQPEIMRMNTELQIEGTSMADALDKLKARREEIKGSLAKMGAVESSIDLGEARVVDSTSSDPRAAMARMMRQKMAGTKPAAGAEPAKSVTLSATIKADWPLKAGSEGEMLTAATELQEKIKGSKMFEAPKSAAKAEEEEEGNSDFNGNQGPKPGEPVFVFVAKFTEADQGKAAADAFGKAKDAAGRLAKAAGATLGALKTLSSQDNDSGQGGSSFSDESSYVQRYMSQMARPAGDGSGDAEALSPQLGKITHQVYVSATFVIK